MLALLLSSCASTVDPLHCELDEHWLRYSVPASGSTDVSFDSDSWGTAPSRMKLRVRNATSGLSVIGCGRDQENRDWELQAAWTRLPTPLEEPLHIEFFDAARLANGEVLSDGAPHFDGALVRCSEHGCYAVEHSVFAYHYQVGPDCSGWTNVKHYDPEAGTFAAEIWAQPGTAYSKPATRITLDIAWDPEELGALGSASAGAGGEGGAAGWSVGGQGGAL